MPLPIYRTTKMEECAVVLSHRYPRVVLDCLYATDFPVRPRRHLLGDRLYIGRWAALGTSEIALWFKHGGVLINFREESPGLHDALLLAECPFSDIELRKKIIDTTACIAIYHSPSWRGHRETLKERQPPPESGRRVVEAMTKCVGAYREIGAIFGIPPDASIASNVWFCTETRLPYNQFTTAKRYLFYRRERWQILRLIPRIEPEDAGLMDWYRRICEAPLLNGERLLEVYGAGWHGPIRRLVRCGSIVRREDLTAIAQVKREHDFGEMQAAYECASARLEHMIRIVENAPILTESTADRLLGQRVPEFVEKSRPKFAEPPVSAAHSDDNQH